MSTGANSRAVFDALGLGDVVQSRRTYRVTSRGPGDLDTWTEPYVKLADVQSGARFTLRPDDLDSSIRIELVKKAKREYKVGDVLSSDEHKAHMWRRGSVVDLANVPGNLFVLFEDGKWYQVDAPGLDGYETGGFGSVVLKYIA